MEDRLRSILSDVNDWLKFAEGKNAAFLAANGVVVFGLLGLANGKTFVCKAAQYYFAIAVAFVVLSALVCLLSFLPQVKIPWLLPSRTSKEADNLSFYGDIAGYDPPSYVQALYHQAGEDTENISDFEEDLAEQAIVNSRIALRKYHLFNLAVWLDVIALLTPLLAIPLYLYLRWSDD